MFKAHYVVFLSKLLKEFIVSLSEQSSDQFADFHLLK